MTHVYDYNDYCRTVLNGVKTNPRGLWTNQIIDAHLIFNSCQTFRRKGDNPSIGFVEGLMFVGQIGDVENIRRVAPRAHLELFTPFSLYGLRVGEQFVNIVDELNNDRYSRRAIMVLARNEEDISDRPCTTSLQWVIDENNLLRTIVNMRSSDAIWGLPYDLIQFNIMAAAIAACTHTVLRDIVVNIGNAHIYNSFMESMDDNIYTPWMFNIPFNSDDPNDWIIWAKDMSRIFSKSMWSDWNLQEKG